MSRSSSTRIHDEHDPVSLLSARRPSWVHDLPQDTIIGSYRDVPTLHLHFAPPISQRSQSSTSPDDGRNFRSSLQIDMKDLVGGAVGNVGPSQSR